MPTRRFSRTLASELLVLHLIVPRQRGQDEWNHQLLHTIVPRRPDPMQPDPCPRRRAAAADDAMPRSALTLPLRYAGMPPTAHSAMTPLPGTTNCFVVTKAMPTGAILSATLAITQATLEFEAPTTAARTAGTMLASEGAGT